MQYLSCLKCAPLCVADIEEVSIEGYYDEAFAVPGMLAHIVKAEYTGEFWRFAPS